MYDAYGNEVDPADVLDAEELTAYHQHERGRAYKRTPLCAERPSEPWRDTLAVTAGDFDPWADAFWGRR